MEIVLGSIPLISVGVLPSMEVVASVIPLVVPSGRGPIPVDIHWDRGVVHPMGGVGRVILGCVLSLGL